MNEQLKSDLLKNEADEFWQDCERKAAELEITVDYYLDEFLQTYISLMIIFLLIQNYGRKTLQDYE